METSFFIIVPHLHDFEPSSGTSIRIAGYTNALNELNIDYRFLSCVKPDYVTDEKHILQRTHRRWIKILLIHNIFFNSAWLRPFSYILRIIIKNFAGIDYIVEKVGNRIIWSHQDNTLAMYLYSVHGKVFIYDIHGFFINQREYRQDLNLWGKLWFDLFLKHEKVVLNKAPYLNVVSEAMRIYVESTYSPKGKILLAPDGIPASIEKYLTEEKGSLINKKFNLPNQNKVILFAGSFKRIGGVLELVKVFIEDEYLHTEAILILIGNGQDELLISKLVNTSTCPSRVFHSNSLPHIELISLMKQADVIVCPDIAGNLYNEMTPHIKLFDAIASGKNVVATDFKVNKELFDPKVFNIYYFSYANKHSFNEALYMGLNCSPKKYNRSLLVDLTYAEQTKKYLCNFK